MKKEEGKKQPDIQALLIPESSIQHPLPSVPLVESMQAAFRLPAGKAQHIFWEEYGAI